MCCYVLVTINSASYSYNLELGKCTSPPELCMVFRRPGTENELPFSQLPILVYILSDLVKSLKQNITFAVLDWLLGFGHVEELRFPDYSQRCCHLQYTSAKFFDMSGL